MYWKQRTKVPLQTLTDYNKYIFTIILEYKNTGNNEKKRLKYKKINHYARLSGKQGVLHRQGNQKSGAGGTVY